MTAVDVDALAKLREAAGFEGWRYDPGSPRVVRDGHPRLPAALITFRDPGADAALIVATVNALPELVAEVRRGRALREAVEGLHVPSHGYCVVCDLDRDVEALGNNPDCEHRQSFCRGCDFAWPCPTIRTVLAAVDAS